MHRKASGRVEDAARFNWALDTDRELQAGMAKLAEEYPNLTEESYTQNVLELFRKAGLELSMEDLKILLALRRETDCMLLRKKRHETGKEYKAEVEVNGFGKPPQ